MTQSILSILSGLLFCRMATHYPKKLNSHSQSFQHSRSVGDSNQALVHQIQLRQNIEPLPLLRKVEGPQVLEASHPRKLVNACSSSRTVVLRTIMIAGSGETLWRIKSSCPVKDSL